MKRAEPFDGIFPQMELPVAASSQVHKRYAASLNAARMVLAGYEHNINEVNIPSYCHHIPFIFFVFLVFPLLIIKICFVYVYMSYGLDWVPFFPCSDNFWFQMFYNSVCFIF